MVDAVVGVTFNNKEIIAVYNSRVVAINPDTGAEIRSYSKHHESVAGLTIQNIRNAVPQVMTVFIKDYEELLGMSHGRMHSSIDVLLQRRTRTCLSSSAPARSSGR